MNPLGIYREFFKIFLVIQSELFGNSLEILRKFFRNSLGMYGCSSECVGVDFG